MMRFSTARASRLLVGTLLLGTAACTSVNVNPSGPAADPGAQTGGGGGGTPAPTTTAAPTTPSTAAPTTTAPTTGTQQQPYSFDSNSSGDGVFATVRLELGQRVFKATHTGSSNFILYVQNTMPGSFPNVAFNEMGAGSWTWTYQVTEAGDYTLDLKEADGQWTLTIE